MRIIILFLFVFSLNGCAFFVAKETAKVIDIITEEDKNPENKKKDSQKKRAREFYCSKVKDPIKCEELK